MVRGCSCSCSCRSRCSCYDYAASDILHKRTEVANRPCRGAGPREGDHKGPSQANQMADLVAAEAQGVPEAQARVRQDQAPTRHLVVPGSPSMIQGVDLATSRAAELVASAEVEAPAQEAASVGSLQSRRVSWNLPAAHQRDESHGRPLLPPQTQYDRTELHSACFDQDESPQFRHNAQREFGSCPRSRHLEDRQQKWSGIPLGVFFRIRPCPLDKLPEACPPHSPF
mmetsp:Transcript_12322/g.33887  ORF Transcript_12322/g.33887 Transcript_12322/m.33887 type:complete len:227 (+) Transcript_12322:183-863(+)